MLYVDSQVRAKRLKHASYCVGTDTSSSHVLYFFKRCCCRNDKPQQTSGSSAPPPRLPLRSVHNSKKTRCSEQCCFRERSCQPARKSARGAATSHRTAHI